jgi:hypothetical protein
MQFDHKNRIENIPAVLYDPSQIPDTGAKFDASLEND